MNFHVDSGNESDVSPERELNLEPTPSPDEGLPSRSYSSELEDPGLDQPVGIPEVPDQEEEEDVLPLSPRPRSPAPPPHSPELIAEQAVSTKRRREPFDRIVASLASLAGCHPHLPLRQKPCPGER